VAISVEFYRITYSSPSRCSQFVAVAGFAVSLNCSPLLASRRHVYLHHRQHEPTLFLPVSKPLLSSPLPAARVEPIHARFRLLVRLVLLLIVAVPRGVVVRPSQHSSPMRNPPLRFAWPSLHILRRNGEYRARVLGSPKQR
jgi:hypothetical protein